MKLDNRLLVQAEELVKQRAARHAYIESEKLINNSEIQKMVYGLIRGSIMLGARLHEQAINELLEKK